MKTFPYLPLAILAAGLAAAPAYVHASAALALSTGAAADAPDEAPAPVIAAADFNKDGIADVVQVLPSQGSDSGARQLVVLLGRPDGSFTAVPGHHAVGVEPQAIVVGDFNSDGNPDVIVGDKNGALLEFLGDGKGNLADAGNIATVGSVVSLAIGHFTHDGKLDLVVSDLRSNSAEILLGAGDGSFRPVWSFPLPQKGEPFHISTADFNKDGIADLVITNDDNDNYEVMLGTGNGAFTYAPELSHLKDPTSYCPS